MKWICLLLHKNYISGNICYDSIFRQSLTCFRAVCYLDFTVIKAWIVLCINMWNKFTDVCLGQWYLETVALISTHNLFIIFFKTQVSNTNRNFKNQAPQHNIIQSCAYSVKVTFVFFPWTANFHNTVCWKIGYTFKWNSNYIAKSLQFLFHLGTDCNRFKGIITRVLNSECFCAPKDNWQHLDSVLIALLWRGMGRSGPSY